MVKAPLILVVTVSGGEGKTFIPTPVNDLKAHPKSKRMNSRLAKDIEKGLVE